MFETSTWTDPPSQWMDLTRDMQQEFSSMTSLKDSSRLEINNSLWWKLDHVRATTLW